MGYRDALGNDRSDIENEIFKTSLDVNGNLIGSRDKSSVPFFLLFHSRSPSLSPPRRKYWKLRSMTTNPQSLQRHPVVTASARARRESAATTARPCFAPISTSTGTWIRSSRQHLRWVQRDHVSGSARGTASSRSGRTAWRRAAVWRATCT